MQQKTSSNLWITLATTVVLFGFSTQAADFDSDSVEDSVDNCPWFFNPGQEDSDPNSLGVHDNVGDACDNCTAVYNPTQNDATLDGFGDQCDPDYDKNGVVNVVDLGLLNAAISSGTHLPEFDLNGDGLVNSSDLSEFGPYMFQSPGPSLMNIALVTDSDGDGVSDENDNCINTANANQLDEDGDGYGNVCDNGSGTPGPGAIDFQSAWQFSEVSNSIFFESVSGNLISISPPQRTGCLNDSLMSGGIATGDLNDDGYLDLFVTGGNDGASDKLFFNNGDATFVEADSSVNTPFGEDNRTMSGLLVDIDGDSDLDVVTGFSSVDSGSGDCNPDGLVDLATATLYEHLPDGTFVARPDWFSVSSEMVYMFGSSAGDLDLDGDLDLITTQWSDPGDFTDYIWMNELDAATPTFTDVSSSSGFSSSVIARLIEFDNEQGGATSATSFSSFTANVTDVNEDGWPDILIAADYGTSQVIINQTVTGGSIDLDAKAWQIDGSDPFDVSAPSVCAPDMNGGAVFADQNGRCWLSDDNGMGASIGDYDNDGHMDWFVTSIALGRSVLGGGPWPADGMRLYKGKGSAGNENDGYFYDMTEAAGIEAADSDNLKGTAIGNWGWGACFADFDNNGYLDIFQVNGVFFLPPGDNLQPARLFMSGSQPGLTTFNEMSTLRSIVSTTDGTGISCADYDNDGDVDVLISNSGGPVEVFQNDMIAPGAATPDDRHHLTIRLKDNSAKNTQAAGARISVTTLTRSAAPGPVNELTQTRELRVGNNYSSHDPVEAHFGFGSRNVIPKTTITWPRRANAAGGLLPADVTTIQFLPVDECVLIERVGFSSDVVVNTC